MNRIHTKTYVLDIIDLPLPPKDQSTVNSGDKWLVVELDNGKLTTIESQPTKRLADHAVNIFIDHAIKNDLNDLFYVYEIIS